VTSTSTNDRSASTGKYRPEYERLLTDLADGSRDAVLIYHVDRLTRRPIELEQFLDVLTAAKVRHVRFVAGGDLHVGNGDGPLVLRMLLAVAANESSPRAGGSSARCCRTPRPACRTAASSGPSATTTTR
jgi:site-specific DNA recombinase